MFGLDGMDGMYYLVNFLSEHYLLLGLFLTVGFVLSEMYLIPEDMRMGKGEVRSVKELWSWMTGKEKTEGPGTAKEEE